MPKDRAAPFSRKHRRYWLPVTGGMILIGVVNVTIGLCTYDPPTAPPERIQLVLPPPTIAGHLVVPVVDAGVDAPARVDATAPAPR